MPPISPRIRSAVVLLLATLGLVGFSAHSAVAADWTIKTAANSFGDGRQDFRYTANPGGDIQDGIVLVNSGTAPLQLSLYGADAFTTAAGRLDLRAKDAKPSGVGAWASLSQTDVTVAAGESLEVPFAITLPKQAAPGDYVGGIVAADAGRRAAIQIHLRVGGALKPSLAVEGVHVDYSGTANPFAKGDATLSYTLHNTGNAILAAHQTAKLSGPFGRWSVDAGKLPDPPSLLPGETWKVSAPLDGVTPALRLTATVTLVPLLTDAAGSTAPLTPSEATGHAWTVPWSLLLLVVVLCGLVVAGVKLRPRRRITA